MMLRRLWKVVVLLAVSILLTLVAQPLPAQVLFGSVSGTISDQSGAGVPKAHVTLINKATSVQKEGDTNENGYYSITDVPPGTYDLTVKTSGFKSLTQTNLVVAANVVTNADAK